MHGVILAISDLATGAPAPERARLGALVLILATLLVFVFGLLVILAVRRSLRPVPTKRKKSGARPDGAWSEAGRRVAPIEGGTKPPADGESA